MTAEIGTLLSLAPVLTALALVDALSLGALAVPVWLLAAPGRLRARRVLLYLGTLAAFYAAVGAVLLLAASAVSATRRGSSSSRSSPRTSTPITAA